MAADGTIAIFDPSESIATFAESISSTGSITGYYEDANQAMHGFVRMADGTIQSFDVSRAVGTFPWSINSEEIVVGYYNDGHNVTHGFVRSSR